MLNQILSYLKARPALVAAAVSIGGTLMASMGLHLTAGQLAGFVALFNSVLAGMVHQATVPASKAAQHGEHEKPQT
jgi:hypothetical protein